MTTYREFHRRSIEDRDAFWSEQAQFIHWEKPFDRVLDYDNPPFARWFPGGLTNLCYNAVDRHAAVAPERKALIYISTETGEEKTYTYSELLAEVNCFAAILKSLGVGKGDRLLIYMPMIPEAIFAMLATVRLGAIHSVVFGGFASNSLATRIDDAQPEGDGDDGRRHARGQAGALQGSCGRGAAACGDAAGEGADRQSRTRPGDAGHARP